MPVDEFHLRNQARELAGHYQQLHGLKHTHPTPPEVRTMKPAPGPQTPGNWLIIATIALIGAAIWAIAMARFLYVF